MQSTLQYVNSDQAVLLGSPLGTISLEKVMNCQISTLQLIRGWLHTSMRTMLLLYFGILSLSIPKLLLVLHTTPAFQTPLLIFWDHLLLSIVSKIMNINSSQTIPAGVRPLFLCGLVVSAYEGPPILHPLPFWPQLMEPIY